MPASDPTKDRVTHERVRSTARISTFSPIRREVEPTFHSRYEFKYLIDPLLLGEIRHFLKPFVQPDRYAAVRPNLSYPICSLYLDSDGLSLYRQTVAGEKDRFKLRIRTYSDDHDAPAFLEVKRKFNVVVHKRRVGIPRDRVPRVLRGPAREWLGDLVDSRRRDAEYFAHHLDSLNARPVVKVRYMREAYQAIGNEPVRVTVDTELTHAIAMDGDIRHGHGRWTRTPVEGTILEIKFTDRYPAWVHGFAQTFGLHQCAVPKYILSLDHLLGEGRASVISLAGLTLPSSGIEG